MSKKPSIILTGGSGLLAINWFYFKQNDYTIYLGLNERKINPEGANILYFDYYSVEKIVYQLKLIRPKVVIHTAGLTSVEKCEDNPELANLINVELSRKMAIATNQLGIPFVHISTDHLFDGNTSFLNEDVPTHPINIYGRTKDLAEKIVIENNSKALIIRTNFYGWGTSYRKSFSDYIIENLKENKKIFLFEDVYYTPIFVDVLIQVIHELLDKNAVGVFNVVSDDRISKFDFGILLAKEFELDESLIIKSSINSITNLVRRPSDMSLSNQKVKKILGRDVGTVQQHLHQLHLTNSEINPHKIKLL
jgi:dTDP-4-dehydrorhamnose reductase